MKKWKSILKNGDIVEENTEFPNWTKIKDSVASLEMDNNGQIIKLPSNMPEYIQGKTASANLNNGECQIESRFIGFVKNGLRIIVRIDERSNNIFIEHSH